MPDRVGRQTLHRLCDSVSGANWRPTRFEDELTLSRYACCVCHVVPSATVLLPCSHSLCEQCVTGCVVQDERSGCPMDTEPFCKDECQKVKLPDKKKQSLKAHCWNETDGCGFVGTIEAVLLHYDRECAFHALQCRRCERKILRTDIAAHHVAGCPQNSSTAQTNRQDGSSTTCDASAFLEKLSTLQRQMNEVSALSQDISRAVSGFENSLRRGMESVEGNIGTILTRQLNAGLEELGVSSVGPFNECLSSFQSQMTELLEQSRQRDASQIEEIERVLSDSESKLKECVNKVEANLFSMLSDQQHFLKTGLDSFKANVQSNSTGGLLSAAASGNQEESLWRMEVRLILRKLELFATESLNNLERLSQHVYRGAETPWVSGIKDVRPSCGIPGKDIEPL
ncbi:hypothetical protein MTO96_035083 [Rhipicephalus appendiculatus]